MKKLEDALIYFAMILIGIFLVMYGLGCLKQLGKGDWLKLLKVIFTPFIVLWGYYFKYFITIKLLFINSTFAATDQNIFLYVN